jgi:hypothetical protein
MGGCLWQIATASEQNLAGYSAMTSTHSSKKLNIAKSTRILVFSTRPTGVKHLAILQCKLCVSDGFSDALNGYSTTYLRKQLPYSIVVHLFGKVGHEQGRLPSLVHVNLSVSDLLLVFGQSCRNTFLHARWDDP